MFTDPLTVTYATVAKPLPAIGRDDKQSVYRLHDGTALYTLTLSHAFGKRNRVVARLQRDLYVTDTLIPANSVLAGATCTFTMDFPTAGLTATDVQNLAKSLIGLLSDANLLKLIGGET